MFSDDLLHPVIGLDLALIWIKPIGHMWYLYVLLLLYLIFAFFRSIPEVALWIGSIFLCLLSTFITLSWFNAYHLTRYAFFFFVGMMFFKHKELHKKSVVIAIVMFISLVIGLYTWLQGNSAEDYFGLQLIVGLGISVGFIALFCRLKDFGTNSFLIWISTYSLEIYILHQYPVAVMTKVIPRIIWINVYLGYVIGATVSLVLIVAIVEIMRKVKLYDLFFRPSKIFQKEKVR